MKSFVIIASALALVASAATAAPAQQKKTDAEEQLRQKRIEVAKARILDALKDPESARFKEVYVAADGETMCGAVNSKNSMGGYVGFQNFMIEATGRIFFDDSGPSFPGMIEMACKR